MEFERFDYERCPRHGLFAARGFADGFWYAWGCPKCAAERRQKKLAERLSRAAIPPRFAAKTLEQYVATLPGQVAAKTVVSNWCRDIPGSIARGTSLILCGRPGTGKTHLACAAANQVLAAGRNALFANAGEIIRAVRETWVARKSEREVFEDFSRVPLLIIDEVGATVGSENEKQILFSILNARYERVLPTFILSNLSPGGVREFLGERAFDRLREGGGQCLIFDWQSYRK